MNWPQINSLTNRWVSISEPTQRHDEYEIVPPLSPEDASRVGRKLMREFPPGGIDLDLGSGI